MRLVAVPVQCIIDAHDGGFAGIEVGYRFHDARKLGKLSLGQETTVFLANFKFVKSIGCLSEQIKVGFHFIVEAADAHSIQAHSGPGAASCVNEGVRVSIKKSIQGGDYRYQHLFAIAII